ncbi:MAG TPA: Rrf2 family transcriptional regulator [bacterium]|nr:Rrf2 family transcriptional regulator [bacterium]
MKLSRESEYGLAGLVRLAQLQPGAIVQLKDIARAQALPQMFLAKTFRKLTLYGVLISYRGRRRGYALARPPKQITVREIVESIEGRDILRRCIFWSNQCSDDHPCLLHPMWQAMRPQMTEALERLTLNDIARRRGAQARDARRPRAAPRAGAAARSDRPRDLDIAGK